MGADQFSEVLIGRDLGKLFDQAVKDAQYNYGHAGYTGTIAEKGGYVDLGPMPSRMTVDRLEELIYESQEWRYQNDEYNRNGGKRPGPNPVPEAWQSFVKKAAEIYDDKWGPALVVQITGTRASEIKRRAGRQGTQDKVWVALGLASS
jgi:hypothetical protein